MSVALAVPGDAPVLFEERPTLHGRKIGIATLNSPKTLNGFSLQMSHLLDDKLINWLQDPAIAVVVLQAAGEKAFCAGGDLHALYKSMVDFRARGDTDVRANLYAAEFFSHEYRLDYRIHTSTKPVLCWGHGIVMGGGIGLMGGASHRVVTERSKVAFPEISVGLYPDVGGSWILNRVPDGAGLFLGLTGAPLNANDAIYAGLADCLIEEEKRGAVLDALLEVAWSDNPDTARSQLDGVLQAFRAEPGDGPLQRHREQLAHVVHHDSLEVVVEAIAAISDEDPWLVTAKKNLAAGAPSTARLTYELHHRTRSMSLADVYRLELLVSLKCAAHGDFAEGIRAILIDKDRNPHWRPATLVEASHDWVQDFFKAPWKESEHPLADLGQDHDVRR